MKVETYINGRPVAEYSEEELAEIKRKLTYIAMKAAGYVPAEKNGG